jgi:predicted outer membrane repeat protein
MYLILTKLPPKANVFLKMMNRIHIFTFLLLICCHTAVTAQRWYVSATATGSGTGTTWQDAFTDVQDALLVVQAGEEIWIANGVYYPGQNDTSTFEIPGGVSIYGGFVGFESLLSDRNLQNAATVFSGDIGVVGDSSDNVWHIVKIFNTTLPILIDGIHFTSGSAWTGVTHAGGYRGAAIWMQQANLEISHCRFTQNYGRLGGAIYQSGGSLEIRACLFDGNRAETDFGGAIASAGNASLEIWDSRFQYNYARWGGAITYNASGNFRIQRSILHSNKSTDSGSALYVSGAVDTMDVSNCLMVANQSGTGSVLYQNITSGNSGLSRLVHCTIVHNQILGTAMHHATIHVILGNMKISNSIIWENLSAVEISDTNLVYANHCNISLGYPNGNNITQLQPGFVKSMPLLTFPILLDTLDYRLRFTSALRNTADSSSISMFDMKDLSGLMRVLNKQPAPGAYALNLCQSNYTLSYTGSNQKCNGNQVTISAPNATQYQWNTGNTVQSITIQNTGRYTVTLYDSLLQCYAVVTDTFTFHNPQVNIIGTNIICHPVTNVPITLKINKSYPNVLWSTQYLGDSIQTYTSGSYYVTVTDSFGCQASDTTVVWIDTILPINISVTDTSGLYPNDNLACKGSFLQIHLSGAHSYKVNNLPISTQPQVLMSISSPQNIIVTGYTINGCPSEPDTVFIDTYPDHPPGATILEDSEYAPNDWKVCSGDSFYISMDAHYAYSWFDGDTSSIKGLEGSLVYGPVNYVATARDSNSCYYKVPNTVSTVVPFTPTPAIQFENDSLKTNKCITYQWHLNSAALPGYTTQSIIPPGTGNYKVYARELRGCKVVSDAYYFLANSDEDEIHQTGLIPYPNPVYQKLFIPGIIAGEKVTIIDIQGRQFIKAAENDFSIETEDFLPGVYTLSYKGEFYPFIKHNP